MNSAGQLYLIGRVGSAKILIVPTEVISRGERIWEVILGEGFYREQNDTRIVQGLED